MRKEYLKKSWLSPKLETRNSDVDGQGVFTTEKINAGEVVIIWGGEVVTVDEFKSGNGLKHTNVGIDENLFLVTANDDDRTIDDYMNHSCNPNLWLDDEVTLSAIRDIEPNEELFMDYAIELVDEGYVMKRECSCNAPNCRKVITGKDWQLAELQVLYKNHFSPFINERIKRNTK